MKKYLVVYIEYKDIYSPDGYCIGKREQIKNKYISANNKKELIDEMFGNVIINIIEIESEVN